MFLFNCLFLPDSAMHLPALLQNKIHSRFYILLTKMSDGRESDCGLHCHRFWSK